MRYFIYFRDTDFAKILKSKHQNSYIKNSEAEVLSVNPLEDDVFILDAHYGGGDMTDLNGLKVAYKLFNSFRKNNVKIWILSWFTPEYIKRNYQLAQELSSDSIEFYQLPLI